MDKFCGHFVCMQVSSGSWLKVPTKDREIVDELWAVNDQADEAAVRREALIVLRRYACIHVYALYDTLLRSLPVLTSFRTELLQHGRC